MVDMVGTFIHSACAAAGRARLINKPRLDYCNSSAAPRRPSTPVISARFVQSLNLSKPDSPVAGN